MLVTRDRFAQGKTLRVKLLMDQKVQGVALAAGDQCDIPAADALYLKSIGRADIVAVEPDKTPKVAAR